MKTERLKSASFQSPWSVKPIWHLVENFLKLWSLVQDTWTKVQFVFTPHKGSEGVFTVKLAEEDFEALEDNQVLVQVSASPSDRLSSLHPASCCKPHTFPG